MNAEVFVSQGPYSECKVFGSMWSPSLMLGAPPRVRRLERVTIMSQASMGEVIVDVDVDQDSA